MKQFACGAALLLAVAIPVLADTVELDGLKSATPSSWKASEATKFRYYQATLPKAGSDANDAELVVFFFGPGGGGGVEENVKRWKGMFKAPEGKTIDEVSKVEKFDMGKVPVTYLDVKGTYMFKSAPFNPNAKAEARPGSRMLAVVFESPNGPYFIRVTGPEGTVEKHKKDFDSWLKNSK